MSGTKVLVCSVERGEVEVAADAAIPPEFKELAASPFLLLRDALFASAKND